jgi:hypothetical protein
MSKKDLEKLINKYIKYISKYSINLTPRFLDDLKKFIKTTKIQSEIIEYIKDKFLIEHCYITGQILVPKPVVEFLIDIAPIEKDSIILNPNCKAGSFLLEAGRKIKLSKLYGICTDFVTMKWAEFFANLYYLNINYFNQSPLDSFPKEIPQADIIFSCLPFGGRVWNKEIINNFSVKTGSEEGLLIQKILKSLKEGGIAYIIISEGILFQKNLLNLRKYIETETQLQAIISLPKGAFTPFTNISTTILILKKSKFKKPTLLLRVTNFDSLPLLANDYKNFLEGKKVEFGEVAKDFAKRDNWYLGKYFKDKEIEVLLKKLAYQKTLVKMKDIAFIKTSRLKSLRDSKIPFDIILTNRFIPVRFFTSLDHLKSKSDNTYYIAIKTKGGKIFPRYLYYLLKTHIFKEQIKSCQIGTTSRISIGCLNNIRMPIVSLDEQKRIINLADKATSYIDEQKLKIELIEKRLSENIFKIEKISKEIFQSKIVQDNPFNELPQMMAVPYKAYKNTTNLDKKYEFLKVCFEVTLKTVGMMILLATMNINEMMKEIHKIDPNRPITDGTWKSIILKGFNFLPQSEYFLSDHVDEIDKEMLGTVIDKLNKLRINEAHPFSAMNEFHKREVVEQFGNFLENFIKEFIFLTNYPLVYFQSASKKHGEISHIVEYLVGDYRSGKEDILIRKELFRSELYFLSSSPGKSLLLEPLIIYDDCPECKCKEIYFFDFIEKGIPKYGGCSNRIKRAFPNYLEEIKKIFS